MTAISAKQLSFVAALALLLGAQGATALPPTGIFPYKAESGTKTVKLTMPSLDGGKEQVTYEFPNSPLVDLAKPSLQNFKKTEAKSNLMLIRAKKSAGKHLTSQEKNKLETLEADTKIYVTNHDAMLPSCRIGKEGTNLATSYELRHIPSCDSLSPADLKKAAYTDVEPGNIKTKAGQPEFLYQFSRDERLKMMQQNEQLENKWVNER